MQSPHLSIPASTQLMKLCKTNFLQPTLIQNLVYDRKLIYTKSTTAKEVRIHMLVVHHIIIPGGKATENHFKNQNNFISIW